MSQQEWATIRTASVASWAEWLVAFEKAVRDAQEAGHAAVEARAAECMALITGFRSLIANEPTSAEDRLRGMALSHRATEAARKSDEANDRAQMFFSMLYDRADVAVLQDAHEGSVSLGLTGVPPVVPEGLTTPNIAVAMWSHLASSGEWKSAMFTAKPVDPAPEGTPNPTPDEG